MRHTFIDRIIMSEGDTMHATTMLKDARMEFKTNEETKQLIGLAATLCGQDVTAYAMGVLSAHSREVVGQTAQIKLSEESNRRLAQLLANPPAPTEAMRQLAELPDLPTRACA